MKEGGSVCQKMIELMVKQSSVQTTSTADEGYSTPSPSLVNLVQILFVFTSVRKFFYINTFFR